MESIMVKKLTEEEKKEMLIPDRPAGTGPWAVWECEPSTFDWHYDSLEKAYLYEGKVKVRTKDQKVELGPGDFVIFPKGLSCTWTVEKKVKKVYLFE